MALMTMLYGQGNVPYSVSYSGGSTYTTQTYGELPVWRMANTMTTEFAPSIDGFSHTEPVAEFDGSVFNGYAEGLWIYKVFLKGQLVATYQMQNQAFCIPMHFDRVEAFCMGVFTEPSAALIQPATPVPSPAAVSILIGSVFVALKRRKR